MPKKPMKEVKVKHCMSKGGAVSNPKKDTAKGYAAGGSAKARRGGFPGVKKAEIPTPKKK